MILSAYFFQVQIHKTQKAKTKKNKFPLDKLTADDVIEKIYTNLNALKIGQYHWQCTQTMINKLVNCMYFAVIFSLLNKKNLFCLFIFS